MKTLISYASLNTAKKRIEEISTLEELLNLLDKEKHPLVISRPEEKSEMDFLIKVYDDYL